MRVFSQLKMVELAKAEVGDLLLGTSEDAQLYIVVKAVQSEVRAIPLPGGNDRSAATDSLWDQEYLSYGKDWFIEPLETVLEAPFKGGQLRYTYSGVEIGCKTIAGICWIDLETMVLNQKSHSLRKVTSWRIWANEHHRNLPNASPIYMYETSNAESSTA